MKIVKLGKHFGVQSKYSDSLPAFVDCQKDSESTGENGTQVKPVLLAVEIFAVYVIKGCDMLMAFFSSKSFLISSKEPSLHWKNSYNDYMPDCY